MQKCSRHLRVRAPYLKWTDLHGGPFFCVMFMSPLPCFAPSSVQVRHSAVVQRQAWQRQSLNCPSILPPLLASLNLSALSEAILAWIRRSRYLS